jgi:hypothetical protein
MVSALKVVKSAKIMSRHLLGTPTKILTMLQSKRNQNSNSSRSKASMKSWRQLWKTEPGQPTNPNVERPAVVVGTAGNDAEHQ